MASRVWKRVLIGAAVCVFGMPLLLFGMIWFGMRAMLSNEEVATLETTVPLLDGRIHVGLYRQDMWDAVLWYVTAHTGSLPQEIPALNGIAESPMQILRRPAQLGFRHPPYQLIRTSRTTARVCEGEARCETIRCDDASLRCRVSAE